ncbi:hypothetical protein TVAG_406180 [Trichomonas vaginalis G3]|uniref:Uncharacterized protein n=1 Tax=Trichomonas vaginalis (strain ATCC PRA-98 / G3) TaxID=412133 RepID=A2DVA8_TRIV3|nr:hypothetical protein TVAGG3_0632050 [Trichomonas vaginalis G3]EAY15704.1 hypothetical protein TVAG_406180 [Trichomonas vaginalis G3]KAI5504598.1 hypothetical protein TVAGG3_0632050 [Trichomonas vaginalis G3]|eukprot:XP_001327927.1 hypothetical protein [Trichomonas vaginalis G3]
MNEILDRNFSSGELSKYGRLPVSEREAHAVRELCFFNSVPAIFYLQSLNPASSKYILESLSTSVPPFLYSPQDSGHNNMNFQHFVNCIARFFDFEVNCDLKLLFLQAIRALHPNFELIIDYIKTQKSDKEQQLAQLLLQLFRHAPPLFNAIRQDVLKILDVFDKNVLFQAIGYDIFDFLGLNIYRTEAIPFTDMESAEKLFGKSFVFSNPEIIQRLQQYIFTRYPFPTTTIFGGGSKLGALFNTAAATNQHIIDLTLLNSLKQYDLENDEAGTSYLTLFPDLKAIALIGCMHKRMQNTSWIINKINSLTTTPKNIFGEFMERLKNDFELITKIKQSTGVNVSLANLSENSLPYNLRIALDNFNGEIFQETRNVKYFTINDQDSTADFDFVCAYFAVGYAVQYFSHQTDDKIKIIDSSIRNIESQSVLQAVIVDIFSLIFLEKIGFCSNPSAAEKIIPLLLELTTSNELSEHLRNAHRRILISNLLDQTNTMDCAMASIQSMLDRALLKKDWQIAEQIAHLYSKSVDFFEIYRDTVTKAAVEGNPHRDLILLEKVLTKDESQLFQSIDGNNVPQNAYKIAKQRLENEPLELFKPTAAINAINNKLSRLTAVSWPVTELNSFLRMSEKLSSFIAYLDHLLPQLFASHPNKTIGEILEFNPHRILSNLLHEGLIEQAKGIAKLINMDITEAVLLYMSDNIQEAIPYLSDYPIVQIGGMIFNNLHPDVMYSISVGRYIDRIDAQKENPVVLDSDENCQTGISQEKLESMLKIALEANPIDSDTVIDVSFRLNYEKFKNTILEIIEKVDLVKLRDTLQNCYCGDELFDRVNILAKVSGICNPYPLKTSLSKLLKDNEYNIAAEFITVFRYEMNTINILREEALNLLHKNESIDRILDLVPALKTEIISSLPQRYQTSILQGAEKFFSSIPKTWKIEQDPAITARSNIEQPEFTQIMQQFTNIDCSKDLISYITSKLAPTDIPIVYKLQMLADFVKKYGPCFKQPSTLAKFVGKNISSYVDSLNIDQPMIEESALKTLNKAVQKITEIRQVFQEMNSVEPAINDLQRRVTCLRKFINCNLCNKYGVEYSFNEFLSNDCGSNLIRLCLKFDEFELSSQISSVWNIECNEIKDNYAQKVIDLGLFDEALRLAVDRRKKKSQNTSFIVQTMVQHVQFNSWVDRALVSEIVTTGIPPDIEIFMDEFLQQDLIKNSAVFQNVKFESFKSTESFDVRARKRNPERVINSPILQRNMSNFDLMQKHSLQQSSSSILNDIDIIPHFLYRLIGISNAVVETTPPPEALSALGTYLKDKAPPSERCIYLVKRRSFMIPFQLIETQRDLQSKWNLFFNAIFIPALSFRSLDMLKDSMKQNDPSLKKFNNLLKKLLEISKQRKLSQLSFDIELLLGRTEASLYTAQELFASAETTKETIRCLDMIERSLSTMVMPEVKYLVEGVHLQKKFCEICVEKGINDCRALNIFGGNEAKISVASFLLKDSKFELGMSIIDYTQISMRSVAERLCDMLVNEHEETIIEFLNEFEKKVTQKFFSEFISPILMRTVYMHMNSPLGLVMIKTLQDANLRTLLLIQFGWTLEAFNDAKATKNYDVMPLIAKEAYQKEQQAIVDEAMKILSKIK